MATSNAPNQLTFLPKIKFHNSPLSDFEKENLFRDSLQQSGCSRYDEPIFVMTRKILEEKFSREIFFRVEATLICELLVDIENQRLLTGGF